MKREPSELLADWLPPERGMRSVMAHRLDQASTAAAPEGCWVVQEQALRIEVQDVGHYTLMCTPTGSAQAAGYLPHDGVLGEGGEPGALALAAGFLFTEGLIDAIGEVASMAVCPDSASVVRVRLVDPARSHSLRRSGLVTSSCGVCANVDGLIELGGSNADRQSVGRTLRLAPEQVRQHMRAMRARQAIFARTGGTHAAALFAPNGTLLALAEDLGRHNALDKVIGHCLLHGVPTAGACVLLSGRVSLEMITKAARAGIELVAAVSAPSSMAIDVAQQLGITLCGFVRGDRLTAFSHAGRLGEASCRDGGTGQLGCAEDSRESMRAMGRENGAPRAGTKDGADATLKSEVPGVCTVIGTGGEGPGLGHNRPTGEGVDSNPS